MHVPAGVMVFNKGVRRLHSIVGGCKSPKSVYTYNDQDILNQVPGRVTYLPLLNITHNIGGRTNFIHRLRLRYTIHTLRGETILCRYALRAQLSHGEYRYDMAQYFGGMLGRLLWGYRSGYDMPGARKDGHRSLSRRALSDSTPLKDYRSACSVWKCAAKALKAVGRTLRRRK